MKSPAALLPWRQVGAVTPSWCWVFALEGRSLAALFFSYCLLRA